MTGASIRNWQGVHDEVLRRIHAREWNPGDLIPNEVDLAEEFGCSRTTVNRALRALAEAGLLDRRRKAGTRIALHPVRKATLDIPVIRREIEARNQSYGYSLLSRELGSPPSSIRARLRLGADAQALHVVSLHLADGKPYVLEDRWINVLSVPTCLSVSFEQHSANEWLVGHAPFTSGDIGFSASNATEREADILGAIAGAALFVIERSTWDDDTAITSVRLAFAPGYRMHTEI